MRAVFWIASLTVLSACPPPAPDVNHPEAWTGLELSEASAKCAKLGVGETCEPFESWCTQRGDYCDRLANFELNRKRADRAERAGEHGCKLRKGRPVSVACAPLAQVAILELAPQSGFTNVDRVPPLVALVREAAGTEDETRNVFTIAIDTLAAERKLGITPATRDELWRLISPPPPPPPPAPEAPAATP